MTDAGADLLTTLGIALGDENLEMSAVSDADSSLTETAVVELDSPPVFSVPRMIFTALLEQVMLVVPTRDPWPPLKNVLITVDEDRLVLTGSDSTSWVLAATGAVRVERPGRVMVGADRFARVVRRAEGQSVDIRCEGSKLNLESGGASWSLRVAPVQDYPAQPDLGDLEWCELDRTAFARAVEGVRFAASKDKNKDHINQLDFSLGEIQSTDELCSARVRDVLPTDFECCIPTSGIDLVTKMLDRNGATQFRVANSTYHTVAEIGPSSAPDRLIVAHITNKFPTSSVRKTFNSPLAENRDELVMNADDLVDALRRADPTADDETSAVALRVGEPESGKVTVATRNRYDDFSTETLDCTFKVDGSDTIAQPRTVVVNIAHLINAVQAAISASALPDDAPGAGSVSILLGQPRSKSKPAYVVVQDTGRTVQVVLSQVRSDWLQ